MALRASHSLTSFAPHFSLLLPLLSAALTPFLAYTHNVEDLDCSLETLESLDIWYRIEYTT